MAKKLHIKTYGCQMNVYDSARMADVMAPLGYQTTDSATDADLIILNTCHIREKASEKVYSELGRIRVAKKEREDSNNPILIAVAGCVAQAEGEEILRRSPFVDIVVGPQSYHELPELVAKATRKAGGVVALDFPAVSKFDHLPEPSAPAGGSAFLSVQEGCDKFCTFCVVPYTRGAEYSRPAADIVREAESLVRRGVVEITLLGQNVNAYHGEGEDGTLAKLIRRLAKIPGLKRIRYTTSHPRDMDADLIAAHGEVEQLMPFLHLPVQSGSDRILKAMNRKHTAKDYLAIIEKLRASRPDIALSSDFIVGFPGETEEDFQATLDLVKQVRFAQAYSFMYSPRPGTPAEGYGEQVPEDIKAERLQRLQALLGEQQTAFNASTLGQTVEVLLEKPGKLKGQMLGKSPTLQSVHIAGCSVPAGRIVTVRITGAFPNSVSGELAEEAYARCA